MTARLPVPGSDDGTWGDILNSFLTVSHHPDGSLTNSAVAATGAYSKPGSGIPGSDIATATIIDANISNSAAIARSKLDGSTQASLTKADNAPTTLAALTDVNGTSSASDTQVLSYNATTSKWVPSTVTNTAISDATTGAKGIVQLAGDLAGTATAPTVPGLTTKAPLASPTFTGTVSAPTLTSTSHVTTNLQVTGGILASGKVLTSDSAGNAGWTALPSAPVSSVAGKTGAVTLVEADIANLTSDLAAKAASSSLATVATSGSYTDLSNKPTIPAAVILDATSTDIQPLGVQAAGSLGTAAKADHVHAMPRHDQVAAPIASVGWNSQKITGLANGTAATDAAAFGQIPVAGTTSTTYTAGNDSRVAGALQTSNNLSELTATATTAVTNLGLGNVNNTSDANKPISNATQTALNLKADASTVGAKLLVLGPTDSVPLGTAANTVIVRTT